MADLAVVDTDILIDVARGDGRAIEFLEQLETDTEVAISAVTQMEMIIGCRNKVEQQQLDRFLERFRLLPITVDISDTAVTFLKDYRLSHGLLIADALIAATAFRWRAELASKNQRDYRYIDGLDLLAYSY